MVRATLPLLLLAVVSPAQTPQQRTLTVEPGQTMSYRVTLPAGFDRARAWPLLLVDDAAKAPAMPDWVVVQPERNGRGPALLDTEAWSRRLLRQLRTEFRIAGNRVHLLGSVRALLIAYWQPQEFRSLLISEAPGAAMLPGALHTLAPIAITVLQPPENELETMLTRNGLRVASDGQRPVPEILKELQEQPQVPEPQRSVDAALDDFHDAAARGDAERYFAAFAPEGVFLGTDRSERWTVEAFKAFALPYFKTGSAWIFVPQSRHVAVAPGGEFAWFDEELGSQSYGFCRGSGALRRIDGKWRFTQYHLTIPIPNDLAKDTVARIREFEARPASQPSGPRR